MVVSTGVYHGFLVKEDGNLYGFGSNFESQLGLGDIKDRTTLTLIPFFKSKKLTKVVCGLDYSIFLSTEIYCCGNSTNGDGQLGFNERKNRRTPTPVLRIIEKNQTVEVLDVFVGYEHSHVLSSLLEIYSFGKNDCGQLGVGDYETKFTASKIQIYFERM